MKILVYGINYSPELTGIGKYTGEMCEWYAARGHEVEMITAMPYYPEWEIRDEFKKRWWHSKIINGVKVCRTPLYVPSKITAKSRILHEFSFVLNSIYFWFPRFFKRYDIVICVCPPLQIGILPFLYKMIKGTPYIFHVQDLQVDMAKELGLIKNKFLIKFLERTEKFLMKHASVVSIISQGMKTRLLQKGIQEEKIVVLSNWVDTDFIKPLPKELSLRAELGFKREDKIILYSGNMGDKQGLEMVIGVAEKLKEVPSVFFVFSGAGASKSQLQHLVKIKGLSNVSFLEVQPYEKLGQLLAMADIHLVLQKKAASDLVFPSKLMSILSAGGLAIITASNGSELYNLVVKKEMGIVVEPEREDALLKAIVENLRINNNLLKEKARNFAVCELSISNILVQFELTILSFKRN